MSCSICASSDSGFGSPPLSAPLCACCAGSDGTVDFFRYGHHPPPCWPGKHCTPVLPTDTAAREEKKTVLATEVARDAAAVVGVAEALPAPGTAAAATTNRERATALTRSACLARKNITANLL